MSLATQVMPVFLQAGRFSDAFSPFDLAVVCMVASCVNLLLSVLLYA